MWWRRHIRCLIFTGQFPPILYFDWSFPANISFSPPCMGFEILDAECRGGAVLKREPASQFAIENHCSTDFWDWSLEIEYCCKILLLTWDSRIHVSHFTQWVMSHVWIRHITHMNEHIRTSRVAHEWVMSHIWESHVTHTNKFCHTYESNQTCMWVMSHTCMIQYSTMQLYVTHMNDSLMSHIWIIHLCHTYKQFTHVTRMNDSHMWRIGMIHSCHTYEWVMSHIWMIHPCHTYEWFTYVTHINDSLMSHI